jgi:hypothetical protein
MLKAVREGARLFHGIHSGQAEPHRHGRRPTAVGFSAGDRLLKTSQPALIRAKNGSVKLTNTWKQHTEGIPMSSKRCSLWVTPTWLPIHPPRLSRREQEFFNVRRLH